MLARESSERTFDFPSVWRLACIPQNPVLPRQVYSATSTRWVSQLRPVFAGSRSNFVVRAEDTGRRGAEMVEVRGEVKVRHKMEGHTNSELLYWDWEQHWM